MKRWSVRIAVVAFTAWAAVGAVWEFFANGTFAYYCSRPSYLLLPALAMATAGLLLAVYDRSPVRLKRRAVLFAWAALASAASAAALAFAWLAARCVYDLERSAAANPPIAVPGGVPWPVLLLPPCLLVIASWLWYEFVCAWTRR